ncbi:MAG TPA: CpsD/CapB family tyrosine-protein kinase [Vicinamibacterales bacterium]
MTRLSDALKRAQQNAAAPSIASEEALPPPSTTAWKFAPVETMHVPDEPPVAVAAPPAPDAIDDRIDPAFGIEAPAFAPAATAQPGTTQLRQPAVIAEPMIRVGDADRNKLIVGEGVDAAMVEQYRHLAAVLHHAQKQSGVRSVMVTSALPAEGKTLTATNLALTLSQSYQRRVLLVDADLRRPRMREMFALPPTEGLTDSLALPREGKLPVHQVSPTLWVLTSGRVLPDPMSMLVSPAMRELLEDARDSFDWVVVDTPPIAILPDANLLAAMIDTTLLVVSAQATPYPMVQRAAQALGTNRILGVVLNRAEKTVLPNNYGYYGLKSYQPGHPLPARKSWFGWLRRKRGGVPHVQ